MLNSWASFFIILTPFIILFLQPTIASPQTETSSSLTWNIERIAAIGDSYAAGVGSGKLVRRGWQCSRYDHAYPYLVNTEIKKDAIKDEKQKEENFEFLPCVGYTADQVRRRQVSKLGDNIDVMTLTVGGNDIGFQHIANDCMFGWFVKPMSRCQKTINIAYRKLDRFNSSIDSLLSDAVRKLTPISGRLYVTGYPQMFSSESIQCDDVNLAFFSAKKPLIRGRRRKFNQLAIDLNKAIEAAVHRAGDQVVFIDIDRYFSGCRGRICEEGVIEPDPDRKELLFYEKLHVRDSLPIVSATRNTTLNLRTQQSQPYMAQVERFGGWIPDRIMRTLHPRSNGHRLIADVVLWHMEVEKREFLGLEAPAQPRSVSCPLYDIEDEHDLNRTEIKEEIEGELDSNFEDKLDDEGNLMDLDEDNTEDRGW